jgi:hypothetical protein
VDNMQATTQAAKRVTPEGTPLVVDLIAVYLDGETELNGVRQSGCRCGRPL